MHLIMITAQLILLSFSNVYTQEGSPQSVPGGIGRIQIDPTLTKWILGFGLLALAMQVGVNLLRMKDGKWDVQGWGPQSVRLFCLTLIIIAVLFLVTVGCPLNELSTAFALLGTLAGFLFGKAEQ